MTRTGWRELDTAIVLLAFVLPLLSGAAAFICYDHMSLGAWNTIELNWTAWALVGLVVALGKSWLLWGDLRAAEQLRRGWRYRLGAWWTLTNALGLAVAFAAWALVGALAGQFPDTEVSTAAGEVRSTFISGGLFMLAESVLIGVLTFGLIARVRLAE